MSAARGPAHHACPMAARTPQIVAFGGGGFSMEAGNPLLDDYVLSLTGAERPRVCFLPTASRAPEVLFPADPIGRRRPLRRALLPDLRRRLRSQSRLAVPARPLRGGGGG